MTKKVKSFDMSEQKFNGIFDEHVKLIGAAVREQALIDDIEALRRRLRGTPVPVYADIMLPAALENWIKNRAGATPTDMEIYLIDKLMGRRKNT